MLVLQLVIMCLRICSLKRLTSKETNLTAIKIVLKKRRKKFISEKVLNLILLAAGVSILTGPSSLCSDEKQPSSIVATRSFKKSKRFLSIN